ncbi:MAG: virulence RhuM family protein [Anaerolineae bacterium]
MSERTVPEAESAILMYQTEDGSTRIGVRLQEGTVWLTQAAMAELFQSTPQNVTLHIRGILADGELSEAATCKEYLQVRQEGERTVRRSLKHYSLEMILAVGYRVRSHRGTQFRRWATEHLHEYLVKGFVLDDERLKEGRSLGADYFDELLERIRDIRASEKRFYQKIRDIYATAVDYDGHARVSQQFYATVQNKMHWAVTGHTAAELIASRADARKPNMGLTAWKGAKVRKADVTVAKNYLSADEIGELSRIVTMYLDYAEDQARNRRPMTMAGWAARLDAFLRFNERDILTGAGRISRELAIQKAEQAYEAYNTARIAASDAEAAEAFERDARQYLDAGDAEP